MIDTTHPAHKHPDQIHDDPELQIFLINPIRNRCLQNQIGNHYHEVKRNKVQAAKYELEEADKTSMHGLKH